MGGLEGGRLVLLDAVHDGRVQQDGVHVIQACTMPKHQFKGSNTTTNQRCGAARDTTYSLQQLCQQLC